MDQDIERLPLPHVTRVDPSGWRKATRSGGGNCVEVNGVAVSPDVGDPFVYVWHVAEDDLGRMIGGEAKIQYTGPSRPGQR